jgi:hypothetical protein
VPRSGTGPLIFASQVRRGDSKIAYSHVWRTVSEELHDAGKAYASTEQECSVRVSELRRDDPLGDSCRFGDLVEGFSESTKQHFPSAWPRQKEAVVLRRIKGAQRSEAAPVGKPMNPPEPAVRFSFCRVGHELPILQERRRGGNRKIDRRTRRCAYRCGGVTTVRCWPDRCAGPVPAEGVDRVRKSAGVVSFFAPRAVVTAEQMHQIGHLFVPG